MSVAEALCDSRELGLTSIAVVVRTCIPQVADFVKRSVDARIAPATIPLGQSSASVQRALAKLAADEAGAAVSQATVSA